MGKEVVVVKESPGFITSRVNALIAMKHSRCWRQAWPRLKIIDKR